MKRAPSAETVAATTRLPPSRAPMTVAVIAPSGALLRTVTCRDADEVLQVVESEARDAPPMTMFIATRAGPSGPVPVARWAIGRAGVRRTAYRGNARDDMEALIRAARNAYVYGGMSRREVAFYLVERYGASTEDAYLASAAGRLATPGEYEPNKRWQRVKHHGWYVDVTQDERGHWIAHFGQPKRRPGGWRAAFRGPYFAGRGQTRTEAVAIGRRAVDRVEAEQGMQR